MYKTVVALYIAAQFPKIKPLASFYNSRSVHCMNHRNSIVNVAIKLALAANDQKKPKLYEGLLTLKRVVKAIEQEEFGTEIMEFSILLGWGLELRGKYESAKDLLDIC